jgi:hypothetical protein
MIKKGQKVYSVLYGGRYGHVVNIRGNQNPDSCANIGNMGVTGGNANFEIIFNNGNKSIIPEALLLKSVQWKVLDEIINEEEIKNLYLFYEETMEKERKKKEREGEEKEKLMYKLLKEYNYLEQGNDCSGTLANKNIRKELKKAFPEIKFSIRKIHYGSITISYNDGIPEKDVETIVLKYEEGNFNGMEDIYEYNNNVFPKLFGGAKYIFIERTISEENRKKIIDELSESYGIDFNDEQAVYNKFKDYSYRNRKIYEKLRERTF